MWPFNKQSETKSASGTAIPADWMVDLFGGGAASAPSVTTAEALRVPAVLSCVRLISEACSSLDVTVQAKAGDAWEAVEDHPVADRLTRQANDWLSGPAFIRDLVAGALVYDEGGLAYVNRGSNSPRELILYDAGSIAVTRATDGTGQLSYAIADRAVNARDIIHVRCGFDRSPLTLAKQAIAVAKAAEDHTGKFFANGAKPGGIIEVPNGVGEDAIKAMKAGWKAAHEGPGHAGKTATLYAGATFRPLTLSSVDAQTLELQRFQNLQIARAFRVPPSMIFELTGAGYKSIEHAAIEFLAFCVEPWLRILEGEFNRTLFTEAERGEYRVHFEREDLSRADLGSRATAYSKLIAARVMNANEARKREGLAPYEDGNAFANPHTGASQPGAAAPQEDNQGPAT